MSSESSDDEPEENIQQPIKKRKQWLKGKEVPRSTLQRWLAEEKTDSLAAAADASAGASHEEEGHIDAEQQVLDVEPQEEYQDINQDVEEEESQLSSSSSESSTTPDLSSDSEHEESSNSSDTDGSQINDRPMNEVLFRGSRSTKGEAVSSLLDLCCKHAVSKALMSDLVEYTHNLLPRPNCFPQTLYYFQKEIGCYIPPDTCVSHYCCEECGTYLGTTDTRKDDCGVCKVTVEKRFYEFPLATQLKYLFEERNLAAVMDSYEAKAGGSSDITKGEEYLKVKTKLKGKYDVVLLTSTDGLSPHKNSSEEIWALTYTICEVPPSLRKAFTMVTQIWYGKKKPFMNGFMVPFSKSINEIYHHGVVWTHPKTKVVHTTKGTAPVHTLDAPARAMLQNITYHSGFFSCNICEIEGECIKHGKGHKTIYPYAEDEDLVLREKKAMKTQTESVLSDGIVCKGVRGDCVLNTIPECNRATALVYDYMHLVLLGVTRQFFTMWMVGEKKERNKRNTRKPPWYIKNKSKIINSFLCSIQRIYEFTRVPKDTDKYKNFKASTWLMWLLFVSVPALHHNLPTEYFQHWLLLVIAMNLLLQEVISEDQIEMARLLLSEFVEEAQNLYGKQVMTYNVHGLLHMSLMVKRWGGLWANSTFLFESFNAVIVRNLHGTIHISEEFANVFGRHVANATLKNLLLIDDEEGRSAPTVKGKVFNFDLSEQELDLLHQHFPTAQQRVPLYNRVQMGKTIFTSLSYSAEKATNNKIVCFKRNESTLFGVLKYFYKSEENILAFVNVLGVDNSLRFQHHPTKLFVTHIIPVFDTEEICVIPFENIICKLMKVGQYVCIPPNSFERNL